MKLVQGGPDLVCSGETVYLDLGAAHAVTEVVKGPTGVSLEVIAQIWSPVSEQKP